MNFTILTPNDSPLHNNKSEPTASNFGGRREISNTANSKDYTGRTGEAPDKRENPVSISNPSTVPSGITMAYENKPTIIDIDDMTDPMSRKREFSYQEDKSDVQKGNEADWRTQSDSDGLPKEGDDGVIIPEASNLKQLKKANRWQFDSSNRYEGEIS